MATSVELAQGNEFSRSAEGGNSVDSALRVYRVMLAAPGEAWDIPATIGVNIGDEYSASNPIPCVSIEARADGESRLVRIVTARYRATPGFASDGVGDPKREPPTARPALWSVSTSLQEIAAWGGNLMDGGVSQGWRPAVNPAGDIVDGISRLEPVVTISIEQYSSTDGTEHMEYVGYVNEDDFSFSSLSVKKHCCMLQGVSATPVVEQFSTGMFRGFKVTFSFAVRAHWTTIRGNLEAIGWDIAVPQCGLNIINNGLGSPHVDSDALNLEHDESGKVKQPARLAFPFAGSKMRAAVLISNTGGGGGAYQRPAAMPVPLNDDGTPRSRTANPPVLINRISLQPEIAFGNNFSTFGIRSFSLLG